MYGLDINFLRDREIRPIEVAAVRPGVAPSDRRPLYLGIAAAVAAVGLVVAYWLFLRYQIRQLEAQEQALDEQIAELDSQLQEIETIRSQIEAIEAENQAFAVVFDQIRPWSALLKELRDRTPEQIQITSIEQTAGTPLPDNEPSDESEGTEEDNPPVIGGVDVSGVACSFDDINDFLLTLQRSPLLDGRSVAISESRGQDSLLLASCATPTSESLVLLVDFTLQGNLSDVPSSDLLEVLESQGAVGLAARVRALRDAGVIETP